MVNLEGQLEWTERYKGRNGSTSLAVTKRAFAETMRFCDFQYNRCINRFKFGLTWEVLGL